MEDHGRNFEHELKKSKEKERKLKNKCKSAVKKHEKFSKENDLIVERHEMLVDELKEKMIDKIVLFQNEDQLKAKEIRKVVDSDFFWTCVQKK